MINISVIKGIKQTTADHCLVSYATLTVIRDRKAVYFNNKSHCPGYKSCDTCIKCFTLCQLSIRIQYRSICKNSASTV